jgi:hypothetical protein
VAINLDTRDFPEAEFNPDKFSIVLSPRFTEHLCNALVVGDVARLAETFHKLADNMLKQATDGDPHHELDLRFTALACRAAADRLLDQPVDDPGNEIDAARKAFNSGKMKAAAEQYKQAAVRLIGHDEAEAEKPGLHERQASEFLSFSSRLRGFGEKQ